ncbi:NAD(+) synthase [Porphyromonas pogonae]|uniref:NAD(+) synthase n=1 Tax=Porphyromonas pogonae TaxID=867595 RepID=UPI002E7681EB|nr:NAD(+) synthase [Porphyromonas pogonae]
MKYGFIKVAAAVPFVKVADCNYNIERIEKMIFDADSKGVEIIAFPELCITGYTCGDLLLHPYLIDKAAECLCRLVERTKECELMAIVGMPVRVEEKLFNAAVAFQKGKILGAIPKSYLPNYREFQEARWFTPARDLKFSIAHIGSFDVPIGHNIIFSSGNIGIGVEICEDMWTPYTPGTRLSLYGAEIIFNLSASNENAGKHTYLRSLISGLSSQSLCGYVYSSCGYGESSTDLVYTGKAFIAECGKIIEEMKRFEYSERMLINDIDVSYIQNERLINSSFKAAVSDYATEELTEIPFMLKSEGHSAPITRSVEKNPFLPDNIHRAERSQEIYDIQVCGLAQRLKHIHSDHAVIGISGGLDSTLALLVTVGAFDFLGIPRENIIGITMPGFGTTSQTYNNALDMMKYLGITAKDIDITDACMRHFSDIGHDPEVHDTTYENAQARERTQILMDTANKYYAPVIGTGDLSELALGWCTFNGDHMSMYSVNAGVPKTSVQLIVRHLADTDYFGNDTSKTLRSVLDTPISPELKPKSNNGEMTQITENIVGPYELHDFFIYHFLYNEYKPEKIFYLAQVAFEGQYTKKEIKKWMKTFYHRFFSQQYKRNCMPDGPKVSRISLSPRGDWRMPSDASSAMWLEEIDSFSEE